MWGGRWIAALDVLLRKSVFSPRSPHRALVETAILLIAKNAGRILDVGCDAGRRPFRLLFFDALVSISVIYHNTLANMRKAMSEIHRILERNSVALLTLQAKNDIRFEIGSWNILDSFLERTGKDVIHHF